MEVSCADHNGHRTAFLQEWDGAKWVKVSDPIEPMTDKCQAAHRRRRQGLCREEHRLAEAHRGLRQAVVIVASPRRAGRGRDGVSCPGEAASGALDPTPAHSLLASRLRRKALSPYAGRGDLDPTVSAALQPRPPPLRPGRDHPRGQQHRGGLRPRDPRAEGRVALRPARRHRRDPRRQRGRQDDDPEGDLEPAARRARRGHEGLDRVRRASASTSSRRTNSCAAAASRCSRAATASAISRSRRTS